MLPDALVKALSTSASPSLLQDGRNVVVPQLLVVEIQRIPKIFHEQAMGHALTTDAEVPEFGRIGGDD